MCRTHLAKSVRVGGQVVPLVVKWQAAGNDKFGEFGWPWELWPWPPSAGCSNTSQPATMWLEGGSPTALLFQCLNLLGLVQVTPTFHSVGSYSLVSVQMCINVGQSM
jgi:hypothetical protein